MRRTLALALALGLVAAACSKAPQARSTTDEGIGRSEAEGESPGLEPVSDWRSERKRVAMLGLSYETGRAVPVPDEVRQVLSGLSAADVERLVAEGRTAFEENRALDAIALFTRAALLDPDAPARYLDLGAALLAFKLEQQATAAYETGRELAPDDAELVFRVGDMAWRRAETDRAVALFERAVELDPNHGPAWGRLARIRYFEQQDDLAWQAIHRARELGEPMPVQLIAELATRTPDPKQR